MCLAPRAVPGAIYTCKVLRITNLRFISFIFDPVFQFPAYSGLSFLPPTLNHFSTVQPLLIFVDGCAGQRKALVLGCTQAVSHMAANT